MGGACLGVGLSSHGGKQPWCFDRNPANVGEKRGVSEWRRERNISTHPAGRHAHKRQANGQGVRKTQPEDSSSSERERESGSSRTSLRKDVLLKERKSQCIYKHTPKISEGQIRRSCSKVLTLEKERARESNKSLLFHPLFQTLVLVQSVCASLCEGEEEGWSTLTSTAAGRKEQESGWMPFADSVAWTLCGWVMMCSLTFESYFTGCSIH